jgi:hypothetical protein
VKLHLKERPLQSRHDWNAVTRNPCQDSFDWTALIGQPLRKALTVKQWENIQKAKTEKTYFGVKTGCLTFM